MVSWPELRHAFAHGFDHTGGRPDINIRTVSGRGDRHWRLTGPLELSELAWSAIRIWPGPGLTRVRDVHGTSIRSNPPGRAKDCSFHYDLPLRAAATKTVLASPDGRLPLAFMQPKCHFLRLLMFRVFVFFMVFHSSLQPYRAPLHLR